MSLSKEEMKRYSRHLVIPEIGIEGQEKLKESKVLVIGAGGLGSPVCLYLAAAGIGEIGIVDFDKVESNNLHRQIIHTEKDVGRPKVESAKEKITKINSGVKVSIYETELTLESAKRIIKNYDIVIDGTDNFPAKYLLNDICLLLGKPLVYGSIFRFEGQVSVFNKTPCYRCLYPKPPPEQPTCAESGVLGIIPGIIGCIQATETIKIILGLGKSLIGRLLVFDALKMNFKELKFSRKGDCPSCIRGELMEYENYCGEKKDHNETQISPQELKKEIEEGKVTVLDVREHFEYEICHIEGVKLIPLGNLEEKISELNKNENIVVHCHIGIRSMEALMFLKSKGFKKLRSLSGGIDAWAENIDKTMTRY